VDRRDLESDHWMQRRLAWVPPSPDAERMEETMKHTPGPWKHYDDTAPAGKTGRHEIVAMGRTVARVYYGDEQARHDARLIAAAPELLAALQMVMSLYGDGFAEDAQAYARVVIAKATGAA
jgi:hypothetical protein